MRAHIAAKIEQARTAASLNSNSNDYSEGSHGELNQDTIEEGHHRPEK